MRRALPVLVYVAALSIASSGTLIVWRGHARAVPGGPPGPRALPSASPSRARLLVDEPAFAFGTVPHGTVVRHSFRIRNGGEDTLEILNIRTSCGCTAADPKKKKLAPGEAAAIDVSFDTGHKGTDRRRQHYVNTVSIQTNDASAGTAPATARPRGATPAGLIPAGQPGMAQLRLEGDVLASYRIIPPIGLLFRTFARGSPEPATATVTILPAAHAPNEDDVPPLSSAGRDALLLAGVPAGVVVTGVRAVVDGGQRGIAIDARASGSAKVGTLDGSLAVSTGNPAQPEVVVPIRGMVQPPVSTFPPQVVLFRDARDAMRAVRINSYRPVSIAWVDVITSDGTPSPLAVERKGTELIVRVRPDAPTHTGTVGEIRAFLTDERFPVARVPYVLRSLADSRSDMEEALRAGVRIGPREVYFDSPDREVSVVISRASQAPLDVRDIVVEPEVALEKPALEPVPGGQVVSLKVKLRAGSSGAVTGRIGLTPCLGAPRVWIRFMGFLPERYVAEPAALVLSAGKSAAIGLAEREGGVVAATEATDPAGRLTFSLEQDPALGPVIRASVRPGVVVDRPIAGEAIVRAGAHVVRVPYLVKPAK